MIIARDSTFLLLLLAVVSIPTQAGLVRVNCLGVQKLSLSDAEVSCHESNTLTDSAGHIMFGYTAAMASLPQGKLTAGATGGAIRDIGYNGGEATALLKDKISIQGEWQGSIPVTVSLWLGYKFAGFGESRVHASLSTTTVQDPVAENRVRIRLVHRGFNEASLSNESNIGNYQAPEDGSYPAQSILTLSVTEMIERGSPHLEVRARLDGYALPNLDTLNPTASSLVNVEARISVSLPDSLELTSESGTFLSEPP